MPATDRPIPVAHAERDVASGVERPPVWPWIIGLVISVAGLGVSAYLTYAHYTSASSLACPDTGLINCAKVTTSSYSHIFGLPVAVLGLAFFAAILPLQLPAAWRSTWAPLRLARLGATVVGVGMVLWLLYVELFRLDAICLYCTAVHALTILLFFSTALGTASTAVYTEDE